MTHGDIKRLEGALKVTLPQRYTELLLRYPPALEENGFHFGKGFEPLSKRFFVKDIDRLIELNKTAGSPAAAAERLAPQASWPAYLVVIGENAGGDYYLLDTGSGVGAVLFLDRGVGVLEPCEDSLDHYIERILHQAEEFNSWHSPHSPLLDASGAERRPFVSEHVRKSEKAYLFGPQDDNRSGAPRTKGR